MGLTSTVNKRLKEPDMCPVCGEREVQYSDVGMFREGLIVMAYCTAGCDGGWTIKANDPVLVEVRTLGSTHDYIDDIVQEQTELEEQFEQFEQFFGPEVRHLVQRIGTILDGEKYNEGVVAVAVTLSWLLEEFKEGLKSQEHVEELQNQLDILAKGYLVAQQEEDE